MNKRSENAYDLDYVYLPQNGEEFENVHVSLKVGDERIKMTVLADKVIDAEDLKGIIEGLRCNTFKRMNLKYGKDCDVIFITGDQKFNMTFDENTYAVMGMKEVM